MQDGYTQLLNGTAWGRTGSVMLWRSTLTVHCFPSSQGEETHPVALVVLARAMKGAKVFEMDCGSCVACTGHQLTHYSLCHPDLLLCIAHS